MVFQKKLFLRCYDSPRKLLQFIRFFLQDDNHPDRNIRKTTVVFTQPVTVVWICAAAIPAGIDHDMHS